MIDIQQQLTTISTELLQYISNEQAWEYQIIPFKEEGNTLHLVVNEEQSNQQEAAEELEVLLGLEIALVAQPSTIIHQYLSQYYRQKSQQKAKVLSASSRNIMNELVEEAHNLGSSDIHLEPYEKRCRVRMRIDGVLIERYVFERKDYPSLVNKIKIQANLDIAEKRLPQDGRIFYEQGQHKFDIRVSVLPTLHGEKVVMRLLSSNSTRIQLESLGFNEEDLMNYLEGAKRPNGMVLISGPTGSGKTTTLYATLHLLNEIRRNILTIEDPIEYTLEGINQVQLKEAIGLDFASALRTFLRQDPDVIMVGEIRDKSTAEMAIRASLTGHLVFSTIHTNSAWGIVSRLVDMGVPSYLIADTLNTAVAQRLVRLLCPHCKTKTAFDAKQYPRRYKAPQQLIHHYKPKGCDACYYTGYRGRKAVYEVINIDQELIDYIKNEEFQVREVLAKQGVKSLSDNAFELFAQGLTSIDEIYPILASS